MTSLGAGLTDGPARGDPPHPSRRVTAPSESNFPRFRFSCSLTGFLLRFNLVFIGLYLV